MLPSESAICRSHNVSRFTAREALKLLQSAGLIATRHGIGSVVVRRQTDSTPYRFCSDSTTDVLSGTNQTRLAPTAIELVDCDDGALLAELGLVGRQRLLRVHATRVLAQAPATVVAWCAIHILGKYAAVRQDIGRGPHTVSNLIERQCGVRTSDISQTVSPIRISRKMARTLKVADGSLGLRVVRTYSAQDGEIFQLVHSYHAGPHAELSIHLRR